MQITSIQSFYEVIGAYLNVTKRNYVYDPLTRSNHITEVSYTYTLYDKKAQIEHGPAAHTIDKTA
jgi:hypothetical protein